MFEMFEECSGTERLRGLVIARAENDQAKKFNREHTGEDFRVQDKPTVQGGTSTTALPDNIVCVCMCV